MRSFPAVVIGGPPDSGKSVLTANLTQALRQRDIQHYVLRACPDGEGDWTHLADQELVRTILIPRAWTQAFVEHICQDLEHRHLPLIVDVGGRPQPWQEPILDCCTHAILLTRDATSHDTWLDLVTRHGLHIVADIQSDLHGESRLTEEHPVLRGVLPGLIWGRPVHSPVFDVLMNRLIDLFAYDAEELRQAHLASSPVELTVDLDRLALTLQAPRREGKTHWEPRHLSQVLDYLPEAVPLGLYGRGPIWLYAAVALLAAPAPFFQFDARLGWVPAVSLRIGSVAPQSLLQFELRNSSDFVHVEGIMPLAYVDYDQVETLTTPPIPAATGVILSGKLPNWLFTSLARTYRAAPWIAVYQPQVGGAVVVCSADNTHAVGVCISKCLP